MQAVILIGIQAAGKSTFYRQRFFDTHVRINLDMLRTRHREDLLLEACLQARQALVVDNTNLSVQVRSKYFRLRAAGFRMIACHFVTDLEGCLARNAQRTGKARIPEAALASAATRLEAPTFQEGFDEIFRVHLEPDGTFRVETVE